MTKWPTFPVNPKDFLSDPKVQRMSDTELGFYFKMLCHEWLDVGIPLSSPVVKAWWSKGGTVAECFFERDGRLFNPRLEKEREKKRVWSEKSSLGGKVGAKIKKINVQFIKGGTAGVAPLKKRHKKGQDHSLLYKGSYQKTSELFLMVKAEWNTLAIKHNLPPVLDILPGSLRGRNLLALFSLGGFDFHALLKKIAGQAFLLGKGATGWRASFDWAIKIDNYMKIMEAQYEHVDQPAAEGQAEPQTWDTFCAGKVDPNNPFDPEE